MLGANLGLLLYGEVSVMWFRFPAQPYPTQLRQTLPQHTLLYSTRPYEGDFCAFQDDFGDFQSDFGGDFGFSCDPFYLSVVEKIKIWN